MRLSKSNRARMSQLIEQAHDKLFDAGELLPKGGNYSHAHLRIDQALRAILTAMDAVGAIKKGDLQR